MTPFYKSLIIGNLVVSLTAISFVVYHFYQAEDTNLSNTSSTRVNDEAFPPSTQNNAAATTATSVPKQSTQLAPIVAATGSADSKANQIESHSDYSTMAASNQALEVTEAELLAVNQYTSSYERARSQLQESLSKGGL